MLVSLSTVLAAASVALAISCDVHPNKLPTLPAGVVPPTTDGPHFIGVALGVQNYTCAATGTFTYVVRQITHNIILTSDANSSVGAVAQLFDASCIAPSSITKATDQAFATWVSAPAGDSALNVGRRVPLLRRATVLGQHFFITNPITGSGLSPKWDFTSASLLGHPDAFAVGARTGGAPAPKNPALNVDWLSLAAVQGDLADEIFRVETRGGQPPTSVCLLLVSQFITVLIEARSARLELRTFPSNMLLNTVSVRNYCLSRIFLMAAAGFFGGEF